MSMDDITKLNKGISKQLIKQYGDNYKSAEVYTCTNVDCPYCGFTRCLDNGVDYDQLVCCCQKCDKKFIMLA